MGECWYGYFSGGFGGFSLDYHFQASSVAHSVSCQLVPGAFPPRVKLQGRAVGYQPAFSHLV